MERGDVVIDAVDLVCVNAHEALLGELRAECTVGVRRRNDLGVRDLRAMLRNTHRPGDVRHGLLHAVGARSEGQQHLPQPEHNLGLMSEAIMRRHTVNDDLVPPTVSGVRVSRMCRNDHRNSIARQTSLCGRRWSGTCGFSSTRRQVSYRAANPGAPSVR